jgi:fluoroquinolone resistance protein
VAEVVDESFEGADLRGRTFEDTDFVRCRFDEAALEDAGSTAVTFTECTFDGAELTNSVHHRSAFLNCSFVRVGLRGVNWDGCKMTGSTFWECRTQPMSINGGDWSYVSLGEANLRGLDLTGVRLAEANLSGADLTGARLADADLRGARTGGIVLAEADLRGARLEGFDPRTADLRGAHVDLEHAVAFGLTFGVILD